MAVGITKPNGPEEWSKVSLDFEIAITGLSIGGGGFHQHRILANTGEHK
jgi:hypothetical protein